LNYLSYFNVLYFFQPDFDASDVESTWSEDLS